MCTTWTISYRAISGEKSRRQHFNSFKLMASFRLKWGFCVRQKRRILMEMWLFVLKATYTSYLVVQFPELEFSLRQTANSVPQGQSYSSLYQYSSLTGQSINICILNKIYIYFKEFCITEED